MRRNIIVRRGMLSRAMRRQATGQNENAQLLRKYLKALLGEHAVLDIAGSGMIKETKRIQRKQCQH